jgi:prepilin-type N-terminal cleavage/methylation domain-containing protein
MSETDTQTKTNHIAAKRRSEGGFTLVELLVVIVIIGILSAVAVFAVSGITNRGQSTACSADKNTVRVAQEANFAQLGAYAADGAALVTHGFLAEASTLYNTAGTATTYTITAVTGKGCT